VILQRGRFFTFELPAIARFVGEVSAWTADPDADNRLRQDWAALGHAQPHVARRKFRYSDPPKQIGGAL